MSYIATKYKDFIRNKLNEVYILPTTTPEAEQAKQKPTVYDWREEFEQLMKECDELFK